MAKAKAEQQFMCKECCEPMDPGQERCHVCSGDPTRDWESEICDAQFKLLKKRFGRDDAGMANYGWVVTEGETPEGVVVSSKVYGHGVLTTRVVDGVLEHHFEEF
jgi:hypothetical protein